VCQDNSVGRIKRERIWRNPGKKKGTSLIQRRGKKASYGIEMEAGKKFRVSSGRGRKEEGILLMPKQILAYSGLENDKREANGRKRKGVRRQSAKHRINRVFEEERKKTLPKGE